MVPVLDTLEVTVALEQKLDFVDADAEDVDDIDDNTLTVTALETEGFRTEGEIEKVAEMLVEVDTLALAITLREPLEEDFGEIEDEAERQLDDEAVGLIITVRVAQFEALAV